MKEKLAKAELETLAYKLAEWHWPSASKISVSWDYGCNARIMSIYLQEETITVSLFPISLDAIFEWLVPKLHEKLKVNVVIGITASGKWYTHVFGQPPNKGVWVNQNTEAETPALALCKAIEALIDKEAYDERT